MKFAVKSFLLSACLAVASASSMGNDELLAMIQAQAKTIERLEDQVSTLLQKENSHERVRKLKKGKKDSTPSTPSTPTPPSLDFKDRNICYAEQAGETISLYASCNARLDYDTGSTECESGSGMRRLSTADEIAKAQDDIQRKATTCLYDGYTGDAIDDSEELIETIGTYEVGLIEIESGESLLIELSASTFYILESVLFLQQNNATSGAGGDALAGLFVTATMWEDCTEFPCTGSNQVMPEPSQFVPLHVVAKETSMNAFDSYGGGHDYLTVNDTVITSNTVKLFFPESKLMEDTTYFITLEFVAQVSAEVLACYGDSFVYMYANATLGPHVIDAEIVKDGDFGNCNWLAPETTGCGLFDKLSDSVDCEE